MTTVYPRSADTAEQTMISARQTSKNTIYVMQIRFSFCGASELCSPFFSAARSASSRARVRLDDGSFFNFRTYRKTNASSSRYIRAKTTKRYQMCSIGFAPMMSAAVKTVNGFVIALAKPKPHATMLIRKPVNESSPIITHSAVTIGSIESISSNNPKNAPKHMKMSVTVQSKRTVRLRNRSATAPTSARIPPTSFITWNAANTVTRNSDSTINAAPPSDAKTRNGASTP